MSSIITFTYCSKWNPANRLAVFAGSCRRAVNFLRESKKQQEILQGLDGKKNREGQSWDRHTNKPRWNHTATDLLHQEFQKRRSTPAARGVGGNESAGGHQSAGGVRGFSSAGGGKTARQIKVMHDRHIHAEHRKSYDLWGVQGFLKEDREGFLEQAALVSKEKTETVCVGKEPETVCVGKARVCVGKARGNRWSTPKRKATGKAGERNPDLHLSDRSVSALEVCALVATSSHVHLQRRHI
jgi:hypothetical protein